MATPDLATEEVRPVAPRGRYSRAVEREGRDRLRQLAQEHPEWTDEQFSAALGYPCRTVKRWRGLLGLPPAPRTAAPAALKVGPRVVDDLVVVGLWERHQDWTPAQIAAVAKLSESAVNTIIAQARLRGPLEAGAGRARPLGRPRSDQRKIDQAWLRARARRVPWGVLESVLQYAYRRRMSVRDLLILIWKTFPEHQGAGQEDSDGTAL